MQIKPLVRYRMKTDSGWLTASAFFCGVSFFAIALYYFFLGDPAGLSEKTMVLHIILPLAWIAVFSGLLVGIRLNVPLVYGILGVIYCVLMCIWGFSTPLFLGKIPGMLVFILCAAGFLVTTTGLLPGKFYLGTALGAIFLMQVFWNDLTVFVLPLKFKEYLPYLARISGVAALSMMCFGMKGEAINRKPKAQKSRKTKEPRKVTE